MNRMVAGCPICGSPMHATEIRCDECDTVIRSEFEPCRFCLLTHDQSEFIFQYLRHRGNIDNLAVSLETPPSLIAARLEHTLAALGIDNAGSPMQQALVPMVRDHELRAILDQLDRGDISADEATRKLKHM